MIAQFPTFSPLRPEHKRSVEEITTRFEPYSDFNFTSLFCWNDGTTELSLLHDNLVLKMADYLTGTPVYSILGDHNIDESLRTLLASLQELHLVPEVVVQNIQTPQQFNIRESRDNFDYIYLIESLAALAGQGFKDQRNKISRFLREFGEALSIQQIDFSNTASGAILETVFSAWASEKGGEDHDYQSEQQAIKNLVDNVELFDLFGLEVRINQQVVGFSINERINERYAICHFQKSLLAFPNLDVYLTDQVAKELRKQELQYVSWEQDLGLAGLRQLKLSYRPYKQLKKYSITSG